MQGKPFSRSVVKKAAELRRAGYTQLAIGKKLGVHPSGVWRWEHTYPDLFPHEPDGDQPHEWHGKRGTKWGKCTLCGCPYAPKADRHRRWNDGEYEKRIHSSVGWRVVPCGTTEPTPEMHMLIRQVAELRAQKLGWKEVVEIVGRALGTVTQWQSYYQELWKAEVKRAEKKYAGKRRNLSRRRRELEGRMRVAARMRVEGASWREIADHFGVTVEAACQWKYRRDPEAWDRFFGEALAEAQRQPGPEPQPQPVLDPISKGGGLTLCSFYRQTYHPIRHKGRVKEKTIVNYNHVLRFWHENTGDPPLNQITDEMLADHLATLAVSRSPATVNHHRRHLLAILYFAGPRGPRSRNARGILLNPPFAESWPEYRRLPRTMPVADARRIFEACQYATVP